MKLKRFNESNQERSSIAQSIIVQVDDVIENYGIYRFREEGVHEVLNMDEIMSEIWNIYDMRGKDKLFDVLSEILEASKKQEVTRQLSIPRSKMEPFYKEVVKSILNDLLNSSEEDEEEEIYDISNKLGLDAE